MKLASWNVNGIRARQAQVQEWIARERPDVVCLQEIKATADQIPTALWEMGGYWCYWHGGKGYSGVAMQVSQTFASERPVFSHPDFDYENRIVAVDLATPLGPMLVASVYVPNGNKDFPAKMRFLEAMDAFARRCQAEGRTVVLLGDMNVARTERDVHPKERKPRAIGQLPEERAMIERILSRGLVDLGRHVDPDNDGLFTWWAPWRNLRQRNIGWRLDYVFVTEALVARAPTSVVQKEVGTSDHAPVVAALE
jgi:exodeoxyribonuclease-3